LVTEEEIVGGNYKMMMFMIGNFGASSKRSSQGPKTANRI